MQNGVYFKINCNNCIKCGTCVACCPHMAITQKHGECPIIDKEKCLACGVCNSVCSIPNTIDKVNEKFEDANTGN